MYGTWIILCLDLGPSPRYSIKQNLSLKSMKSEILSSILDDRYQDCGHVNILMIISKCESNYRSYVNEGHNCEVTSLISPSWPVCQHLTQSNLKFLYLLTWYHNYSRSNFISKYNLYPEYTFKLIFKGSFNRWNISSSCRIGCFISSKHQPSSTQVGIN